MERLCPTADLPFIGRFRTLFTGVAFKIREADQPAFVIGCHDGFAIVGPADVDEVVLARNGDDALTRFDVPEFELFVRTDRDQFAGVRVERRAPNRAKMGFDLCDLFAGNKLPKLDELVAASRREQSAVRTDSKIV